MRRLAVVVLVAAACRHGAPPPTAPSNSYRGPAEVPVAFERKDGHRVAVQLLGDLDLVRSFAGLQGSVPIEVLAAAERAFEQIRWKGLTPASVMSLLGQPSRREPAEHKWRYDFEHELQSAGLILRFRNGVVDSSVLVTSTVELRPFGI